MHASEQFSPNNLFDIDGLALGQGQKRLIPVKMV
jgi:hypothetical protein